MIRHTLLLLIGLMLPFAADAQDLNKLWIPDVTATAGEQVTIPVYVRNTCNDLVGAQFELTLPNGVTLDANSGQVSSRCTDHEVLIRRNGNAWRVMVYSPSNTRIQGNAGIVVNMQATLGNNFQAEGHYPMSIDRVILSSSEGNNVITAHDCGELIIGPSADFIVRNVRSLTETLIPGETFTATWTVTNQGHARSHSGWKEEVFLLNNSGELSVLSTIYCSDSLATGASVNHSAEIMVPALPGIEGTVMLQALCLTARQRTRFIKKEFRLRETLARCAAGFAGKIPLRAPAHRHGVFSSHRKSRRISCEMKIQTFGPMNP